MNYYWNTTLVVHSAKNEFPQYEPKLILRNMKSPNFPRALISLTILYTVTRNGDLLIMQTVRNFIEGHKLKYCLTFVSLILLTSAAKKTTGFKLHGRLGTIRLEASREMTQFKLVEMARVKSEIDLNQVRETT